MNENVLKGKWNEIKGDLRKTWSQLTDDEIESTKGDLQALAGMIQQRYGMAQEEARNKLNELFQRFAQRPSSDKGGREAS